MKNNTLRPEKGPDVSSAPRPTGRPPISLPGGGLLNLPFVLALALASFVCLAATSGGGLAATPGGGDGGLVNLPGGGGARARIQLAGGYVLVQAAEEQEVTVYVAQTLVPLGTMPSWPAIAGETTITTGPWTCSCHQIPHSVSTKVSTRYMQSDLEKHDRKLAEALRRHPPQR